MDPEEFAALLQSLSPEEQDQFLYDMGFGNATQVPWSFGGAAAPSLDYGNYDLLQMGGGVDIPELTTKGAVDPYDLTQEGKRVNLAQDKGALLLDNILSGMAGGGAYDTDAFTPTYDYGEPLNLKGRRTAETLAQTGGWEAVLADLILNEQMSPSQAESTIRAIAALPANDPDRTPEDEARRKAVVETLPPAKAADSPFGIPAAADALPWDFSAVSRRANEVFTGLMEDPEFAYEMNGKFYERTPEEALVKTPQMEFFDKYGLPYPTASYNDPQYLESTLDAQTGSTADDRALMQQAYDQEFAGLNRQVSQASGEFTRARDANTALQGAFRPQPDDNEMLQQLLRSGGGGTQAPVAPGRMAPAPSAPVQPVPLGGTAAAAAPVGPSTLGGRGPTMPRTPYVYEQNGNVLPYDFANPPQQGGFGLGEMAAAFRKVMAPDTVASGPRRATTKDRTAQRQRRQDTSGKVQQLGRERYQATFRDPRLAGIEQAAYLSVLANAGRTPFNDAVAVRQQGNRALGV